MRNIHTIFYLDATVALRSSRFSHRATVLQLCYACPFQYSWNCKNAELTQTLVLNKGRCYCTVWTSASEKKTRRKTRSLRTFKYHCWNWTVHIRKLIFLNLYPFHLIYQLKFHVLTTNVALIQLLFIIIRKHNLLWDRKSFVPLTSKQLKVLNK